MAGRLFKRLLGDIEIIPVVMFHSVGLEDSDWIFAHISEPFTNFEEKIASLYHAQYNFLFWSDLHDYVRGSRKITLPAVMLTFDDGYLDNWVFVYPLLKKYGAKATIFVTPEFVDPSTKPRPNLDDVSSGMVPENHLQVVGFLNWEEMRIMLESGLVDIQSHGLTHTWYFSRPRLIDFQRPNDNKYPWMAWNARPDQKPFYLTDSPSHYIPLGTPIYQHEKALICRRYFPPQEVASQLTDFVDKNGASEFFRNEHSVKKLHEYHDKLMETHRGRDYYETPEHYRRRVFHELHTSKSIIENNLNKPVEFVCWPGGAYNEQVLALASEAGYKAWTLSSAERPSYKNTPGSDPTAIKRVGSAPIKTFLGRALGYTNGADFLYNLKAHQNSAYHKYLGRCRRAVHLIYNIITSPS